MEEVEATGAYYDQDLAHDASMAWVLFQVNHASRRASAGPRSTSAGPGSSCRCMATDSLGGGFPVRCVWQRDAWAREGPGGGGAQSIGGGPPVSHCWYARFEGVRPYHIAGTLDSRGSARITLLWYIATLYSRGSARTGGGGAHGCSGIRGTPPGDAILGGWIGDPLVYEKRASLQPLNSVTFTRLGWIGGPLRP